MLSRVPRRFFIFLLISFLFGLLAVVFIPQIDSLLFPGNETPSFITFMGVGLVTIILTGFTLRFGLDTQASYTKQFLLYAFLYNLLIALAKFTLGPFSLYVATLTKDLSSLFLVSGNFFILLYISALIFLLYIAVLLFLYSRYKIRLARSLSGHPDLPTHAGWRKIIQGVAVLLLIPILIVAGGSPFAFPILLSAPALEYLSFVFSTLYGIVIASSLVGAIYFAKKTFDSATDQALLVKDATLLVSLLWIGISFLLLYHALWVVYFLVLMTLWPLKVVTPK